MPDTWRLVSNQNLDLLSVPWSDETFMDQGYFDEEINEALFQEAIERPNKHSQSESTLISPEQRIIRSIIASWPAKPLKSTTPNGGLFIPCLILQWAEKMLCLRHSVEWSEEPIPPNRHVIETHELLEAGLKTGLFTNRDGGNYILLEDKVHRICSPANRDMPIFIVIWVKDGPDDMNYSEEKEIGAVAYNPHKFTAELSIDKDVTKIEQDQGIITGGAMVKSVGPHATNTKLWDSIYLKDDTIIDEDECLLSTDINIFIQAHYYALLSGTMPMYAKQVMAIAQSNLMNRLGVPSMSHFHAFNYSASSHLEKDDSPSIGWMHWNTANFFWSKYHLVLEMQEGMYWWWSAMDNEHGTTMNHQAILAGKAKPTWGKIKAAQNEGQWTSVTVLPKSINKAAKIVNRSSADI
ncbi:hypothetical protein CPB84DRAFT_1749459 [Gymnopilus junonius]|uniref:Uncharacterized protein n=1 Tax=Gymnopilus junonius TaxID=109634 RepID=A0A9P5TJL5_GYMJU|nr:hypothetical protein CPB84DRAFT_1749459 [Gymnopilus junonius]